MRIEYQKHEREYCQNEEGRDYNGNITNSILVYKENSNADKRVGNIL
jgi:hypothetical protein